MGTPPPASPNEITAEWLTAALRQGGALSSGAVTAVRWEAIGEEHGFTGVVARLHLGYDGPRGGPARVVAKLPTAERTAPSGHRSAQPRDASGARRHYERSAREVHFYRELASGAPVPRLYHGVADDASGRVVLLLEDVVGARAGDVLRGCSADEAARVLEAIAPLHARWWSRGPGAKWLPRWGGDHGARQERYARQVGPVLDRIGSGLDPAFRDVLERMRERYADVLTPLDAAPATLIHGDLHLDNVLFAPPGPRSTVVLDWQSVASGPAAMDVGPFVFGSLDPDERRRGEAEILRAYHARLVEHGVQGYGLERLGHDCRLALLRQVAGMVGWLATVDPAEAGGRERALLEAALGDGRLEAAALDHDVAALLRG